MHTYIRRRRLISKNDNNLTEKTLKTFSSGQIYKKNQKTNKKKPTGLGLKKKKVFSNPASSSSSSSTTSLGAALGGEAKGREACCGADDSPFFFLRRPKSSYSSSSSLYSLYSTTPRSLKPPPSPVSKRVKKNFKWD